MELRAYEAGDEIRRAELFNARIAAQPAIPPRAPADFARRTRTRGFNPERWVNAWEGERLVGFCDAEPDGRIDGPWCAPDAASAAPELLEAAIQALPPHIGDRAYAAVPLDWAEHREQLVAGGFAHDHDVATFLLPIVEMPTIVRNLRGSVSTLNAADIPLLHAMAPQLWSGLSIQDLEQAWLKNPWFGPEAFFVLRDRAQSPLAAGLLIQNDIYANPQTFDSDRVTFLTGAFGNEAYLTERRNGLFSLIAPASSRAPGLCMSLLSHATSLLDDTLAEALIAQVPTQARHLLAFYQAHFRPRGRFAIHRRAVSGTA